MKKHEVSTFRLRNLAHDQFFKPVPRRWPTSAMTKDMVCTENSQRIQLLFIWITERGPHARKR